MTEIPEHLLKRSRERRAAAGGGDSGGGDAAAGGEAPAASSTPAKATPAASPAMPAHPAPAEVPAARPPSPMVEAHRSRNKIPFWAMPVLAIIPVWAYVYVGTLDPPPQGEGPEVLGTEIYASSGCGGCHGAGGGGGVGPAFTGGSIYETFPGFEDHMHWVRLGSAGWLEEVGPTRGANQKPVNGGMPAFGELSDADLFYVVMHERILGGENPSEQDQLRMDAAAALFFENPEMTLEEVLAQVDEEVGPSEGGGTPAGGQGDGGTEGGEVEGQGQTDAEGDQGSEAELEGSEGDEPAGDDSADPVNG